MIKAIITDVDGVIVGTKHGINSPLPSKEIIKKLKELNKRGIPIILCTGKPSYAIEKIILAAELDNPHITDAGAYIYHPLQNKIIKEHSIPTNLVKRIAKACLDENIYLEVQEAKNYYVQKNQIQPLTEKRVVLLQRKPMIVDSLLDIIEKKKIIKMLPFINDISEKQRIEKILSPFADETHTFWSTIPAMLPAWTKVVTVKGVSKYHASQEVLDYLNLSFEECLGIGDLPSDWLFIKHCRYGGIVGDADQEFKRNVMSKGEGNYFLGKSVDEDGFLQILDYFKLSLRS